MSILNHPAAKMPCLKGRWVALLVGLFWLSLPWFGLPGPHRCDDLVFVAPALDFAHGRPMSSHIVTEVCGLTGGDVNRWLSHPPVYQQVLGCWLRIFGISNGTMLWFQVAVDMMTYCGLLGLMRRFGIHAGWSVPPAAMLFSAHFRTWGMRPEALGLLFLVLGVVCILRRDSRGDFLAGVFLAASAFVSQQAGIFSGLFFLVALANTCIPSLESGRLKWRRVAVMLAGGSIPALCFLIGIGWDIPAFLRAYTVTLKGGGGMAESRASVFSEYLTSATLGWEWVQLVVIAPLLLIVIAAIVAERERFHRWVLTALVVGIVINIVVVKAQAYRVSFMYVLVVSAAFCILGALQQAQRLRVGWACLCLVVVLALGAPDLYGRYRTLPTNADEVRHAIAKAHYSAVYFDDYAAWYVFGWLLPEKAQSLQNSKKYSPLPPRAGEIYIVPEADYRWPHPRIFGREFASVNLNNERWDVVDFRGVSLLSGSHVGLHLSNF